MELPIIALLASRHRPPLHIAAAQATVAVLTWSISLCEAAAPSLSSRGAVCTGLKVEAPNRSRMRTAQLIALLLLGTLAVATAQDVSVVLAQYPQYSKFNELLQSTGVLAEVNSRSTLTLLLPENGALNGYVGAHPSYTTQMVADVIRYHVLLQYFGGEELSIIPAGGNVIVPTLLQTTGRANDLDGFVNITAAADGSRTVGPSTPGSPVQANILTNVTQYPYNYSFLAISAVLEPLGLAAAQLAPTSPPTVAPTPAPATEGPVMAPTDAPVSAPMTAPVEAPVDAPVTAPVEAPVDAPVTAPVEAPVDAPVTAPVEAPVDAPVTAPVEAPVDAPVTAPVEAPVDAPVTAPVEAPVVAPAGDVPTGPVVPTTPGANEPSADAPEAALSGAFAVRFNVLALVASGFAAALML